MSDIANPFENEALESLIIRATESPFNVRIPMRD